MDAGDTGADRYYSTMLSAARRQYSELCAVALTPINTSPTKPSDSLHSVPAFLTNSLLLCVLPCNVMLRDDNKLN